MENEDIYKDDEYIKINSNNENNINNANNIQTNPKSFIIRYLSSILTGISIIILSLSFCYCCINYKIITYSRYLANIEILLFSLNIILHIVVTLSDPGYQNTYQMSFKEFIYTSPTVKLGDSIFLLKYCPTCKIVREIRTFHCNICNRCIRRHDHHCLFISNCIGKENSTTFFTYLTVLFIHSFYILFVSIMFIIFYFRLNKKIISYDNIIILILVFITLIVLCFFIFITILFIEQIILISKGITKNEYLRKKYNTSYFEDNCLKNWKNFCINYDFSDEAEVTLVEE